MEIKQRESRDEYSIKRIFRGILKFLTNRRTKIFLFILILIIVFIAGGVIGLIVSGFFGTFDNPSDKAVNMLYSIEVPNLKTMKNIAEGVVKENVKIPFNYVIGQFSDPEKIYIDIAFKDYQQLEYKREQALERGVLISYPEDYVPAKIRYKDKNVAVNLRLKGDLVDHLEGKKWSLRIKVNGDERLFGFKTFSIQDPKTRNYLEEYLYYRALEREDILSPKYKFIEVVINGKKRGIYALEEHFETQMIEGNERREGIILNFEEGLMWEERMDAMSYLNNAWDVNNFIGNKSLDWFYSSEINTFTTQRTLNDPALSKQFQEARDLLESFRNGELKTKDIFDIDRLAKYFAVNTVLRTEHASIWGNIRFYYNPITAKFEPIGFDGSSDIKTVPQIMQEYAPDCLDYDLTCLGKPGTFYNLIFRDSEFFIKYMKELEIVSQKAYLEDLFSELNPEIDNNLRIIHKDNPFYHFPKEQLYNNQEEIKRVLNPRQSVKVFFQEGSPEQIKLAVGNIGIFPLEVIDVVYNNTDSFTFTEGNKIIQPKKSGQVEYQKISFSIPSDLKFNNSLIGDLRVRYKIIGTGEVRNESILPWAYVGEDFLEKDFIRQAPISGPLDFLEFDEKNKIIRFKQGIWTINKSLIIPEGFFVEGKEGTVIDLADSAMILSYSNLKLIGTDQYPIKIISSDGTGQGLTVINAKKDSIFEYVEFKGLTAPSKENWEITGALTFYESPIVFNHVIVSDMKSEDSIDLIKSVYKIANSIFKNCFSDCIDDDFGGGTITNTSFENCGNDCIDISGAVTKIEDVKMSGSGDKGVSAGERSKIRFKNLEISKGYVGIASKDESFVEGEGAKIFDTKYGLVVYQKKTEYGPAEMKVSDIEMSSVEYKNLVEKSSSLSINGKIILGSEGKVYEKLYPLESK